MCIESYNILKETLNKKNTFCSDTILEKYGPTLNSFSPFQLFNDFNRQSQLIG